MTDVDTAHLTTQVLWAAFGLSLLFGFIAHRSRFCTMGAIADVVSMGHWERARMWALAVAMATLGFNGMVALGWVEARNTIYAVPRLLWLSAGVGGGLFGFGMVLASGCGSRNLVRLGGGNLKSLVVLIVMADQLGRSVGDMYQAAFIPGFLLTALYAGYIFVISILQPKALPRVRHDQ